MDRLSALIILVLLVAACEDTSKRGGDQPSSRVNAAKTGARQAATSAAFCDVHATTDDKATTFRWPAMANGVPTPAASAGWRWVNVWATWCEPCIEEMPRLLAWRDKLAAGGRKVELAFVSIDESDDAVTAFRKLHPEIPASTRIADPSTGSAWFRELGLAGDPSIPIHVFVSPAGRVRCVRASGVREQDFGVVEKLLAE